MKTIKFPYLFASLTIMLPVVAFAQSSDSKYCVALSHQYDKYVADPNAKMPISTPADIGAAKSKCDSDPTSAIPVLEKALTDKKITLPSRG